jgi:two-component system, OmpR family, sensor kinase
MGMRSIRARLTLWYTGLLTITLLLLGGAAYALLAYSLAHDVDAALNSVAHTLVEEAQRSSVSPFPAEIDETFRRFFGFSPRDRYFQKLDPYGHRDPQQPGSGKLALSPGALQNASRGLPTFETLEGLGPYPVRMLTAPVLEGGRVVNLIQVGMSLQNVFTARNRFLLVMAVLLPLGLLLAGGGGWLLARRALKPVRRMTETAHRITAEHLAERVPETAAGDELDRLAKTFNDMLGRLDAAFNQIRQFSADASHELQTPLTILKGELEVALRAPRSVEEYQQVLKSGLQEIDRIAHLVEGLLLLARAQAGVLRMDHQPVDLTELVEDVYERLKILADTHSIDLQLSPLEPVTVHGDHERLRRLLLNLVENGIKYTRPGGSVTLALERQAGWAMLRVADTGIGLAEHEQEQIFQPFYRSPEALTLSERGVGLGLSIARSIALAHGGSIQVASTPGQGSVFTVLIPADA